MQPKSIILFFYGYILFFRRQMIKECNIQNYSIYLFGEYLFAYFEYVGADFEADMAKMARDENTQKWWKVTDPCQISLGYAGQKWLNMEEVFHLD